MSPVLQEPAWSGFTGQQDRAPRTPPPPGPPPSALTHGPAQVVLTFHKMMLLDEKNMCMHPYGEPSHVDCSPCRKETLRAVTFQTEINEGSLAILAPFCQVLSFSRNHAELGQIQGEEIRPSLLHNHPQLLECGASHLVISNINICKRFLS